MWPWWVFQGYPMTLWRTGALGDHTPRPSSVTSQFPHVCTCFLGLGPRKTPSKDAGQRCCVCTHGVVPPPEHGVPTPAPTPVTPVPLVTAVLARARRRLILVWI